MMTSYLSPSFSPLCSVNIIYPRKRLWICHSHYFDDENIHLFPEEFAFISCKYLHFICFVLNLHTKHLFPEGINGYFYIRKLLHYNGNIHLLVFKIFKVFDLNSIFVFLDLSLSLQVWYLVILGYSLLLLVYSSKINQSINLSI